MVKRTERIWLQSSYNLMQFSHKAKNLYNYANFIFKKQLERKHFTSEFEMNSIIQGHPVYSALPAQTAQQTIKFLVKSWKSYFKALKVYKNIKKSSERDQDLPDSRERMVFMWFISPDSRYSSEIVLSIFPELLDWEWRPGLMLRLTRQELFQKVEHFCLRLFMRKKVLHWGLWII